jgi:hypothetical protein
LAEKLGGQGLERIAAKELAKKIPIPVIDERPPSWFGAFR